MKSENHEIILQIKDKAKISNRILIENDQTMRVENQICQ